MTEQLDFLVASKRADIATRYRQWASTPDGRRFLDEVRLLVLSAAVNNPKRIEINAVWSQVRGRLHMTANNDFRAPAARELVARYVHLEKMIELRNAPKSEAAA